MSLRHTFLLGAAFLLGGCEVVTELGKPCALVRRATDEEFKATGERAVLLKYRELTPGQDFISFGSLDCEEQICVRDANMVVPEGTGPETVAQGYCSRPCVEDSSACEVTTSDVFQGLSLPMTCRPMLLDDEALNRLKAADPDYYRKTFGAYENSSFCAGG